MDDSTRLDETEVYRRMEAREIPEETYYHVPRRQEVAVFGQAAAVLPDDRPAFRRRWVTQPVTLGADNDSLVFGPFDNKWRRGLRGGG